MVHWLMKRECFSVQRLARQQLKQVSDEALAFAEGEGAQGCPSISFVAEDLMAKVLQVSPDLVSSSCMECKREE